MSEFRVREISDPSDQDSPSATYLEKWIEGDWREVSLYSVQVFDPKLGDRLGPINVLAETEEKAINQARCLYDLESYRDRLTAEEERRLIKNSGAEKVPFLVQGWGDSLF